ncbi:hypothetical protein ACWC4J_42595, partial [Streptomyces sp. NPDC001356]
IDAGTYVRVAAGCWREARVLAATQVTYTATDRFHLLDDALELAIGTAGRDALRLGGGAAGGPVLDAHTGAVVGVLGTALHSAQRDVGFAVPLRPLDGALADLLARNAATVPAFGADLNLAGVLQLTTTPAGHDGLAGAVEPVERPGVTRGLAAFAAGDRPVLGLVGAPGCGRTTELAALTARRARGERPAPTLRLRGADLRDTDDSVADAARRSLARAARAIAASRSGRPDDLGDVTPERVARLAARAGRPLLILLDCPEEMPPALADRLSAWAGSTATWLAGTGTRLVVACREEHWECTGRAFPPDVLHVPGDPREPDHGVPAENGEPQGTLPGTGPDRAPAGPARSGSGRPRPEDSVAQADSAGAGCASADSVGEADGAGGGCGWAGPAVEADGVGVGRGSAEPGVPECGGESLRSAPAGPPAAPPGPAGLGEPPHGLAGRPPSAGASAGGASTDGAEPRVPLPRSALSAGGPEADLPPAGLAPRAGGPEPHPLPAGLASPEDSPEPHGTPVRLTSRAGLTSPAGGPESDFLPAGLASRAGGPEPDPLPAGLASPEDSLEPHGTPVRLTSPAGLAPRAGGPESDFLPAGLAPRAGGPEADPLPAGLAS